jgi:hypothetical protein
MEIDNVRFQVRRDIVHPNKRFDGSLLGRGIVARLLEGLYYPNKLLLDFVVL